jgi:hypothetical protein
MLLVDGGRSINRSRSSEADEMSYCGDARGPGLGHGNDETSFDAVREAQPR